MKQEMYNVEKINKYSYKVNQIENIEDAADDFMSREELEETFGERTCYGYSHYGTRLKEKEIKAALEDLKSEIKNSGGKSIIIKDQELIDTLKDNDIPVSQFVEGLRRVGNRLSLFVQPAEKTVPMKRDADRLIVQAIEVVNEVYCKDSYLEFIMKSCYDDREGALKILQKLITWEQVKAQVDDRDFTEVEKDRMKQVWDNPAMFTVDKSDE